MTVGKLIELMAGKAGVLDGHFGYGTGRRFKQREMFYFTGRRSYNFKFPLCCHGAELTSVEAFSSKRGSLNNNSSSSSNNNNNNNNNTNNSND